MKREFLTFVIGVLIGAIIATGVFLVLQINDDSSSSGASMEMPSGEMGDFDPNSIGGERPNGENEIDENTSNSAE